MEFFVKILSMTAGLLYTASAAGYIVYLFQQKENRQKAAFILLSLGVGVHFIGMALQVVNTGNLPVHNMRQTLSVAAFAIAGTFIVIRRVYKLKILGIFAACLAAVIMMSVMLVPEAPPDQSAVLNSFWLWFHIILVFSGEAALALACGAGILYLLQEHGIKTKQRGFFYRRLPSLALLDSTSYMCIAIGFTLLTCGLATGFIYAKAALGRFWGWDQKEIWSMVTWLFYAALLHCRLYSGWQGKKSAVMTIVGFALLVFTFLGVNLLLGGYHQVFTR